ncbi:MAG: OB-fold domain-containing protein [Acidimicrobiales bacterium]
MSAAERPVPVPDQQSEPFWRAAADHVLVLARCAQCQATCHPPEGVCPHCGTTDPAFEFEPVGGSGTVRSWTVIRESFLPGFDEDLPFVLVDVELEDPTGVRMIGRLVDGPDASLQSGAAVRVAFEDLAPGVAVPAFALARVGSSGPTSATEGSR